jgi:hypothetical protein
MSDSGLYPLTPGYQNTDTSKQAADSVASKAEVLRRKCLAAVRSAPRHNAGVLGVGSPNPKRTPPTNSDGSHVGITVEEASRALGEEMYNINPRFSELRSAGLIRDSGVRRLNSYSGKRAIAWTPGDDPAKPRSLQDNAPPKTPAAKAAYIRGMAASFYMLQALPNSIDARQLLRRRLAELEPSNPEWEY